MKLIKFESLVSFIFAVTAFLCMGPYLTWNTYRNGEFSKLNIIFLSLNLIILIIFIITYKIQIKSNKLIGIIALLLFWLYQISTGITGKLSFTIGGLIIIITICIYLYIDDRNKQKIFNVFSWIFALSLISGIIVSILSLSGFNLKYDILLSTHEGKILSGVFYKHYFGSIFITGDTWDKNVIRICGMFDEPGLIGTISALLLVADEYKLKGKIKNIILLIAGILSFSFAFFVMSLLYLTIKYFNKGIIKSFIFLFIVLACCSLILNFNNYNNDFNNYNNDNVLIKKYVIDKFTIKNGNLVGNDRTTYEFNQEYSRFLNSKDLSIILFGYGKDATIKNSEMIGSYSYKVIIYNYGLFGFSFLICWLILFSFTSFKNDKNCLFLLIIFLVSIYQRPDIISIQYIIILFGGYANLKLNNFNNNVNKINDSYTISTNKEIYG